MNTIASSRLIVDLKAFAHNLNVIKRMLPNTCKIMAVIKADAYGLGAVAVAQRALECGVAMLGVATVEEGIALRKAGIEAPVLVMVQPHESALAAVMEHQLRVMISDVSVAERLSEQARRAGKVALVHCKIDTGMGRQGFDLEEAVSNMMYLTRVSNIDIEGVATHFAQADIAEDPFTLNQIKEFKQILKQLDKRGIPYEIAHAANSPGVINYPTATLNMVRPGLMMYGVWPTQTPPEKPLLRPVVRWESNVVLLKYLETGSPVGYGQTYVTRSRMHAAIVPVGYADGYRYALANRAEVLIAGTRCPIRGSVSMDQIIVDVSNVPTVNIGDAVTLIGTDGSETITPDELARHAQTIPYDILTSISPRVAREYLL